MHYVVKLLKRLKRFYITHDPANEAAKNSSEQHGDDRKDEKEDHKGRDGCEGPFDHKYDH